MCYSAQIEADYRRFVHEYGAIMSLDDFTRMVMEYFANPKMRVPRAMTAHFLESPETEEEKKIAEVIRARMAADEIALLQELAKQTERLEKAQQALAAKATKKAAEDVRIATNKIEAAKGKLEELKSTDLAPRDSRIYPGWYAPVMVMENGRRVVKPMRYQCRPAGKPAFYDEQYPGTYNARRDNLRGFWKGQYGHTHGLVLVDAFYENVAGPNGKNLVLEFRPDPPQTLLVACVWSHWRATKPGEKDLLSFAIITDDPPPEITEAGHDRCPVPIKSHHLDTWLTPDAHSLDVLDAILDERPAIRFTHKEAK
ncbi:SOS response-associated peptidase family protein [Ralstonia pickettii]|uniref:SOS response-associated peptidase family protein n=1 Tax=Ralstonia pickettii TaxID=329 RepID=UPI0015BD8BC2|nr:SOS response-associated peptidase family protein [Ralstonia pickettii]NWK44861.1 SOS response-associated peptidase family protein [Ralstonia pickettii]